MAKNLLLLYARLYVEGADLSGDSRTLSELKATPGQAPASGWKDQVRRYQADGVLETGITGYQAFMNPDAEGAFTVLKDNPSVVASMFFGAGEPPAIGDTAYILSGAAFTEPSSFDSKTALIKADILPGAGAADDGSPWGKVLQIDTELTSSTESASVDNGASSVNGYRANLHIIEKEAATDWAFEIEHSADGTSWATLGAFTLDGSALDAESITGTGTVNRYVRFKSTCTDGSVTVVCALTRN